jgi:hypothetical protein
MFYEVVKRVNGSDNQQAEFLQMIFESYFGDGNDGSSERKAILSAMLKDFFTALGLS